MLGLGWDNGTMSKRPAPSMVNEENRRVSPRRRVAKAAKLAFGDFVFVRDCSVSDTGPDGARIRVDATHEIPNEFHLVLTSDRLMRKAQVVWRKEREIGVRYLGEARNLMQDTDPRLRQFQLT